ncbi:helix-turn-helix transcriptional regulator [Halostagnicola bangensis]
MGNSSADPDILQTVAKRSPLLERLEDGPAAKPELIEVLDCSRSTINRAIRELEGLDCIRRTDDGFQLTVAGRLALSEHRRSLRTFESVSQLSDLLRDLPAETPIAVEMVRGATLLETPPHAPSEPLEEIIDLIGRADRVRGMAAADRMPQFRRQFYDGSVNGDLDVELLLTEDLARFTLTEYTQGLRELIVDGGVDLYAVETVPYELSIVETPTKSVVYVILLNSDLTHRGVIRNDSADAIEWAHGLFRRHRASATSLSPFDDR